MAIHLDDEDSLDDEDVGPIVSYAYDQNVVLALPDRLHIVYLMDALEPRTVQLPTQPPPLYFTATIEHLVSTERRMLFVLFGMWRALRTVLRFRVVCRWTFHQTRYYWRSFIRMYYENRSRSLMDGLPRSVVGGEQI